MSERDGRRRTLEDRLARALSSVPAPPEGALGRALERLRAEPEPVLGKESDVRASIIAARGPSVTSAGPASILALLPDGEAGARRDVLAAQRDAPPEDAGSEEE